MKSKSRMSLLMIFIERMAFKGISSYYKTFQNAFSCKMYSARPLLLFAMSKFLVKMSNMCCGFCTVKQSCIMVFQPQ